MGCIDNEEDLHGYHVKYDDYNGKISIKEGKISSDDYSIRSITKDAAFSDLSKKFKVFMKRKKWYI